jgi:broad specificity phosphatase PhoE
VSWLLVRHARAGSRKGWEGPDIERPLSKKGRRQADGLVDVLEPYGCKRILSSPYLRCSQTVEPLAEALGLEIEMRPELAEGAPADATLTLVRQQAGTTAVFCTHGDIVPELLDALAREDGLELPHDYDYAKGSVWVIEEQNGKAVSARYLAAPASD